jgi:hypothetical protein
MLANFPPFFKHSAFPFWKDMAWLLTINVDPVGETCQPLAQVAASTAAQPENKCDEKLWSYGIFPLNMISPSRKYNLFHE